MTRIFRQPWNLETISPVMVFMTLLTKLYSKEFVTAQFLFGGGGVVTVKPPQLFLPLTVEPTKPRLCHDNRLPQPVDYGSSF